MKLRTSITAITLALGLVGTGACSRVPVAAVRAAAVTTVSVATVTVTASPPSLPDSPSQPATAPATSYSETEPTSATGTSDAPQPSTDLPTSAASSSVGTSPHTAPANPAPADTETTAWVEGICTEMGTVLNELAESKPQLAENSSVGTVRQAMVDYYASSTKTVSAAYDDSKTLAPPNVADGEAIHRAYQHFLSGLGDTFYQAALDMTDATDLAAIRKVNDAVDQHITALGGNNAALQAMSSGGLADVAEAIPACQTVSDTASGT